MENLIEYAEIALGLLLAGHTLALAVVNLTETPADDKIVGKVYKVVEKLAGLFGDRAKQFPGESADLK